MNGLRDALKANSRSFSFRCPTDDGRIKPDLVANGDGACSALNGSNSAYGTLSGAACHHRTPPAPPRSSSRKYRRLFLGSEMRSSKLKALFLDTADDRADPCCAGLDRSRRHFHHHERPSLLPPPPQSRSQNSRARRDHPPALHGFA